MYAGEFGVREDSDVNMALILTDTLKYMPDPQGAAYLINMLKRGEAILTYRDWIPSKTLE